jgi:rare lipoprotein A
MIRAIWTKGLWIAAVAAFGGGLAAGKAVAQGTERFSGTASFYSKDYKGRVASGALYDGTKLTAAHRTLPFGTRVRVTDPKSHRSVDVVVNDRGPFTKSRVIDLSYAAALALHITERGLVPVTAVVQ